VLLYRGSAEVVTELDQVRDSMLTSTVLDNRVVGAYWEVYGLSSASGPVKFSLSVEPFDIGWTRRLAQRVGLTDPATGLRLQWDDAPRTVNGILSRGVRVDLSRLAAANTDSPSPPPPATAPQRPPAISRSASQPNSLNWGQTPNAVF